MNEKMNDSSNPFLRPFVTPYQAPPFDEIREEHFLPAIKTWIKKAEEEVNEIATQEASPTFENTIEKLEQSGQGLSIVSSILFNLNHAETSEGLQKIAQEASPLLTDYSNRLLANRDLFNRIRKVKEKHDGISGDTLDPEQITVLNNWYRDFERNGALLEDKERTRFGEIRMELAKLSLAFADHVLAETNSFFLHLTEKNDLVGLPTYVVDAAAEEAKIRELKGWVFTLQAPSYIPFLKFADRRDLREKLYRAYVFRCNQGNEHDNKDRVTRIVNLRLEMAQLMGEPNYATYRLKVKMAENPERVYQLLRDLHDAAHSVAGKEFREVSDFAKGVGFNEPLQPWDWSYYAEKLKEKKYGFREEMLKPYFELHRVIDGVFGLANRLFGLRFTPLDNIPVYHSDVQVFQVTDEQDQFLALLYADFFPRKGKQGGAWMTSFRDQRNIHGDRVRPHVSIVCNFTKPSSSEPSLLTFDEVNTLLHEFGHALHGMLSQVTYPSISGTSVYQDFVELPSQLMENWITESEWLNQFAIHYKTGERIPSDLIDKLIEARNFLEGYATERQLGFGLCDMAWHQLTKPFNGDVVKFEQEAVEQVTILPRLEGMSFSPAFSHIFAGGYAAGYYGYKWAEVLDADAFSRFKKEGIFNREVADSFREHILEKGGSEHPMVLYKRFRGQEPTVDALLMRSGLTGDRS